MTIEQPDVVHDVLTASQWQSLRERARELQATSEYAKELSRRRTVGEAFQALVRESGLLDGSTLTRDALAEMVRLQWQIQNLNALPLVRLLGTYAYYKHFKDFQGDEAAFEAYMRSRRSDWPKGSVGHPGADLADLSRDMRELIEREGHAIAFQKFSQHPGIGRGFTSGVLHLQIPKRFGLLNGASLGVFDKGGLFPLENPQLQALAAEVRRRQNIADGGVTPYILRTLGLMLLFEELRQICGFVDFHGVDFFHWHLSKSSAAKGGGTRLPHAVAEKPVDTSKLFDALEDYAASIEPERIRVRAAAEDRARELLAEKAGRMSAQELRQLFGFINEDYHAGKTLRTRFAPAFLGKSVKDALEVREATNRWIAELWNATPDSVERVLDEFWQAAEVPSAGRSLPTAILYIKDPERYTIQINSMARGLAATLDERPAWLHKRGSRTYLNYNRVALQLRETLGVSPQAMDLVLWKARLLAEGRSLVTSTVDDDHAFDGFSSDTFAFLRELEANNSEAWFDANRTRFRDALKNPLRGLVEDLGRLFAEPYAPGLERAAKSPQTMSRMRKNSFGRDGVDPYWTHYWAAFHRKDRKKVDDFQLFVFLRETGLEYGFRMGSARQEDIELFRHNAEHSRAAFESVLESLKEAGFVMWKGDAVDSAPVDNAPSFLAALDEDQDLRIGGRIDLDDARLASSQLTEEIAQAFQALYPLFLLGTSLDFERELSRFEDVVSPPDEDDEAEVYSEEWLRAETLLDEKSIADLEELLEYKRQIVFYGPPGTGKTWLAERFAQYFAGSVDRVSLVQFHPSYGYEDFVEGFRPVVEDGQVVYRPVRGIFRQLCEEAQRRPKQRFVLVIDEINRGNLPRILGELLYLLERRGKSVVLPVSQEEFSVPPNIYLIGTMNTADQSIALLDAALRRRFHFVRLDPSPELLLTWLTENASEMKEVADLLQRLNDDLGEAGVDYDRLIGHSHFMVHGLDEDLLARVWTHSVLPTLEEFFYGTKDRLQEFELEAVWKRARAIGPDEDPREFEEDVDEDDEGDA